MKTCFYLFLALLMSAFFTACPATEDDVDPLFEVPDTYIFERDGQSTIAFGGQTTRINMAEELTQGMLEFDRTQAELDNMFTNPDGVDPFQNPMLNESTKSLRSKVAASRDLFFADAVSAAEIKADFDAWISAQVDEIFPNQNVPAAPGQAGQLADGSLVRYVNDWGLEYNEALAKGLIGGLMYDQLVNNYLSPLVLDEGTNRTDNDIETTVVDKNYTTMEHKWDEAYGYLFGASANPALPLDDVGAADDFLNAYLGLVDEDPDFRGIASTIEFDFRSGRAALVAGEYLERNNRAQRISELLTNVLVIRAIYSLKQGQAKLQGNPLNRGGAFHDLSEAYGFIYSFRFINGLIAANSDNYLATLRNAAGNGWWDINPSILDGLAFDISVATGIDLAAAGN